MDSSSIHVMKSLCKDQRVIFLALSRDVDLEIYTEAKCRELEAKFGIANTRQNCFLESSHKFYHGLKDASEGYRLNEEGNKLLLSDSNSYQKTLRTLQELPQAEFGRLVTSTNSSGAPDESSHAMEMVFSWLLSVFTKENIHRTSPHYCEFTHRHMKLRESWNDIRRKGAEVWDFAYLFSGRRDQSNHSVVVIALCVLDRFKKFMVEWAAWRRENSLVEGFGNLFKLLCADTSRKVHDRESKRLRIDADEIYYFKGLKKQVERRYSVTGEMVDGGDGAWYGDAIRRGSAKIAEFEDGGKLYITYLDIVSALLNDDTRVGREEPCGSKKHFAIDVAIPGNNGRPRYLDFNHFYCFCDSRMTIINGWDFGPEIMKRIVDGMRAGKYFELIGLLYYILESLALIAFTEKVVKFEKLAMRGPRFHESPSTSKRKTLLTKILVSLDEQVGFTRLWNEIRALDPKNSLCECISLTQKFCLDFVDKISEDGENTIHFQRDKVMSGMLPCAARLSELLSSLEKNGETPEVIEMLCVDMETMLVELALVPCNAAAVTLGLYIESEIRPLISSHRQYFCNLISDTFTKSLKNFGPENCGKCTGCLLHIALPVSEYALPKKNDPRHPDNRAIILRRVALLSVLPNVKYYLESFSGNGPVIRKWVCDYHLQLHNVDLKDSFEELYCLILLFSLCAILPLESLYSGDSRSRTIITRSIQLWRREEKLEDLFKDLDVGGGFGPIIKTLEKRENEFFNFMYGSLMSLVRDMLFADSYRSDAAFNAKIREMAASGPFSFILCRGSILIPRLKRWFQSSAKLGLMIMEIHGDYIWSHIEKQAAKQ
jgi:hypothetical protein